MDFKGVVEAIGLAVDASGVAVIIAGLLIATAGYLRELNRGGRGRDAYVGFRHDLGRAILLGLEFLVAGDIIRTVAVAPTLQNVLVLGIIVLIRTFLSISLEVELEGRWPWTGRGVAPTTNDALPRALGSKH